MTTETTTLAADPLAEIDAQQQVLEGKYRALVLQAASGEPIEISDAHLLASATGRTPADFRRDVEKGQRRLAAARTLEQNDVRAADEAAHQARAALDEAAAECRRELEELQRRHAERLRPLHEALEQARQHSRETARSRQQAVNVLLTTRSAAIDQAIASANRAATVHQDSVNGASEVLFRLRRKLKQIEAANINDASRQREVDQLKRQIANAQADLEQISLNSPAPPPPDSAWLDWTAFDLSPRTE